jgi:CheY-like chemotaxis protein
MPKLLLADDSVTIQRVIEMTFAGEDITVIAVGDGEQAIARLIEDRPDIVLADIAMPKRSGYDVAAFMKSRPELASIPVLLLAGAFDPVDQARAEQVKCDGVLVKPFEPAQVIARVRELLGGARGNASQSTSGVPRPVERLTASLKLVEPRRERPAAEVPPPAAVQPPARSAAPQPPVPEVRAEEASRAAVPGGPDRVRPTTEAPAPAGAFPRPDTIAEGLDDSLDDYFDRLDAAFASLSSYSDLDEKNTTTAAGGRHSRQNRQAARSAHQSQGQPEEERHPLPTLDSLLGVRDTTKPAVDPMDFELPPPVGQPPVQAPIVPPQVARPVIEPPETPATIAPQAAPVTPPASPTPPPSAVVAPEDNARPSIADAFTALLAAELGEAPPPAPLRPVAGQPKVTDELVDAVTRRVIERLAPDAVRQVVVDVVSELAERLIREEIARIRDRK